ncbi:hypothetical protein V7S43_016943 [Phytophthora oleae]|uniref:Uncharacterized protein n=1 Tax=Phytophthora oleae TaxID=2107226 RepID=A0ABD3EVV8_9STRA
MSLDGARGLQKWDLECSNDGYRTRVYLGRRLGRAFGYREVANLFRAKLRDDPTCKPQQIQADMRRVYGVECSYKVCFNARELVVDELNGDRQKNFTQLLQFLTLF